ncbi:hypothetical protein Fisuc_0934 [Fibrobacter succinogenes subsp. succinogenes S85]|uniref:Uncharacterized protein n=1 Tax=Fibrobacter succinogenes (strain ATCC 19169 / S85) TaxID=59374 RepID=A0ABM5LH12_FIBSS|nr:hypothetical protein [Fibrobacter succinogenes]ACX74541.1 hypothetical protein Fisuc_0934 [Fibrobacter succinogenes subsp. succinogenes S85]
MDFSTFERLYIPYCETTNVSSGKARSYYLAIKYLAEYLNLPNLGYGNAYKILEKENDLSERNSIFYRQLLRQWDDDGHSSYLKNGFVQAAISYFRKFAADNNLL